MRNKSILITGGTGSFGKHLTLKLLKNYNLKRLLFLVEMNLNNINLKMKLIRNFIKN